MQLLVESRSARTVPGTEPGICSDLLSSCLKCLSVLVVLCAVLGEFEDGRGKGINVFPGP